MMSNLYITCLNNYLDELIEARCLLVSAYSEEGENKKELSRHVLQIEMEMEKIESKIKDIEGVHV